MNERQSKLIDQLNEPLATAMLAIGYWLGGERTESDGSEVFEFISSDRPTIEVKIKND